MKPIDYRNATWEELQESLSGMRRSVYDAWLTHGPGTTAYVAMRSGINILTFRPRSTDLFQMGLLRLIPQVTPCGAERAAGGGIYAAIPEETARQTFEATCKAAFVPQELRLESQTLEPATGRA